MSSPQKMAFSGPSMCNKCSNHYNWFTWFSYSNRNVQKKWHFLDLICPIHVETEGRSFLLKFPLLKKWHFLDLVCSVHVVTLTIGFSYSNRSLKK